MWTVFFFFFQAEDGIRDVAVTGVQTCALPIWCGCGSRATESTVATCATRRGSNGRSWKPSSKATDRKSTRLNSSHGYISYAVFCLKKKKKIIEYKVANTLAYTGAVLLARQMWS